MKKEEETFRDKKTIIFKKKKASCEDKYCNLLQAKDTNLQWVWRAN